jgi:zinc/manganese transport system substrate-binding protein
VARFRSRSNLVLTAAFAVAALVAGCGIQSPTAAPGAGGGKLQVVAAENFWGSLAAQLGGDRVRVKSVIVNPDTDPHSYEPTANDAVTLAGAQMAIVNGVGYDRWASQVLSANQSGSRIVLNVGDMLGLREGDNAHQWYSPAAVKQIMARIVHDYQQLDPKDAGYFAHHSAAVQQQFAPYNRLIAQIRARYHGVPVGYSESIFQPMGNALGLDLATPYSFAKAIAEGTEVSAGDKRTVDAQAQQHQIKVWVYNRQNVTPDVQRVNGLARAAGIPITTITETLSPPSASFEQWQVSELEALRQALHKATGR